MRHISKTGPQADKIQRMLAALCHQAKQPLTALRGTLEVALIKDAGEQNYREALEQSLRQADRLVDTINLMGELIESTQPWGSLERVVWSDIVRDALDEFQSLANDRGVKVILDAAGRQSVQADSGRLFDATSRALRAAIQRSPAGKPLTVSLSTSGHGLCLRISDQGPPLRPGELDPRHAKGSGESLSVSAIEWWMISHTIAVQGGRASFENLPGGGCSLHLELPLLSSHKHPKAKPRSLHRPHDAKN